MKKLLMLSVCVLFAFCGFQTATAEDEVVIGIASAESGWMQAYSEPAARSALIRIDEINNAGGLLGKKLKVVRADTKTDRAQGARAGLMVLDAGAELVLVDCDYDYGAPAAQAARLTSRGFREF